MASQVDKLRQWRDNAILDRQPQKAKMLADKVYAITNSPDDACRLAQAYSNLGQHRRGSHLLISTGASQSDLRCRLMTAECLFAAKEFSETSEIIGNIPSLDQFDSDLKLQQDRATWARLSFYEGEAYMAQNNYEKAKDAYEKAVFIDAGCFDAFNTLMEHKLLSKDAEIRLLRRMDFRTFGDSEDLMRNIYNVKAVQGTSAADRDNSSTFTTLSTEYNLEQTPDLISSKAWLLYWNGKVSECLKLCETALDVNPYDYDVMPSYLACLCERKDLSKLFRLAHSLAENVPDLYLSWFAVGLYYLTNGDPITSRSYFSKASLMNPHSSTSWCCFGHSFAVEGEHEHAITAYSTAARVCPGSHFPLLYLGMEHMHLNNLSIAEEYFNSAFALCENDPLLLNEMALVQFNKGQYTEAETLLTRAISLLKSDDPYQSSPVLSSMLSNLANTYRKQKKWEQSAEAFNRVLRADPEAHHARSALGLIYLQTGNVDRAIEILNQALARNREDPIASDLIKRAFQAAADQPCHFGLG